MTKRLRRGLVLLAFVGGLLSAGKAASAAPLLPQDPDTICVQIWMGSMGHPVVCVPLYV